MHTCQYFSTVPWIMQEKRRKKPGLPHFGASCKKTGLHF